MIRVSRDISAAAPAPARAAKSILEIADLAKTYNLTAVLRRLNLAVRPGELCVITGPSGCGKSTLLRLIAGQEQPDAGRVVLDGRPVGPPSPDRGIIFQQYGLFPHLTILDNVLLGPSLAMSRLERVRNTAELRRRGFAVLKKVRLGTHWRKYPHQLSGGMRQRAALAQALIMRPRILMMDEPFSALDSHTRDQIRGYLSSLWREFGMTVLLVTHDLDDAVSLGNRLVVLRPLPRSSEVDSLAGEYDLDVLLGAGERSKSQCRDAIGFIRNESLAKRGGTP